MNINTIPKHSKCKNCGECCGPVPINEIEGKAIREFLNKNKPKYNKEYNFLLCKFRIDGKCSIYPVRPVLCRLMGVTRGMSCINGNSHDIDGMKFLNIFTTKTLGLLNDVIKIGY